MTEEQQKRIYDAAQDVVEAVSDFVGAVCKLLNEVIESIVEWYQSVCKQVKKYNCNNWRRNHRLPLIHRNKKMQISTNIMTTR